MKTKETEEYLTCPHCGYCDFIELKNNDGDTIIYGCIRCDRIVKIVKKYDLTQYNLRGSIK